MISSPTSSASCKTSMKLLGDYWTLRIIDALRSGDVRFCELQRATDDLNPTTLTSRLKKLEASGLVERSEEAVDGCSVSYSLTERGQTALPVIRALNRFAASQPRAKAA